MAERWGTAKEYAVYYKLLLTVSGRREFLWWLEKQNQNLYQFVMKELKIGSPIPRQAVHAPQAEPEYAGKNQHEAPDDPMGQDLLAGSLEAIE